MLGLDYLYADEDIAVIDKKEGMLSVPGRGEEKKDSAAYRFHTLFPRSPAECTCHRLDMDTSGLLVLAFTKEAKRTLSMAFENREVKKEYEALLEGVITEDEGIIDIPIRLDIENRPYQIRDDERGKKAVTLWKRLGVEVIDGRKYTRVRFYPQTGRTHQLRVHSSLFHTEHSNVRISCANDAQNGIPRFVRKKSRVHFSCTILNDSGYTEEGSRSLTPVSSANDFR